MYGAGAAFFCLEPTQVGRSRSRLRDLGDLEPEPEPPKKVAAPQHWSDWPGRIIGVWTIRMDNNISLAGLGGGLKFGG